MSRKFALSAALVLVASLTAAGPRGTVPKPSSDRYPARAEGDGTKLGAALLTSAEVRQAFVFDVSRACLVVEVALYPPKDKEREVSLDDFSLHVDGTDITVRPSSANTVAAKLQQQSSPSRDVGVESSVGVGYESGTYTDPVTGQQVKAHGVYTEAGAGVGVAPGSPRPGSSERDRAMAEADLTDKGLPEGKASSPIAGYLYFPIVEKKKHALQLEYEVNGTKVVLQFPQK
jgi:hypothetical protein